MKSILLLSCICFSTFVFSQTKKILLFASHEETYYSEYIVMLKSLEAAGYQVDVRSAGMDSVSTYMLPDPTTIDETANTMWLSNYAEFQQQFMDFFGIAWDETLNATPDYLYSGGRIQDIVNMDDYDALVLAGGTGALAYRRDGSYSSQGTGDRMLVYTEVQAAAEKLNELALDALSKGKPVLAQCHGASLPVYWRIPSTSGPGEEGIGYSLLKGQMASGYPDNLTAIECAALQVNYIENNKVTVSSPHPSFDDGGFGAAKIITSRDWYPQTVVHAAKALLNVLETYPTVAGREHNYKVLVMHGGAIDPNNCSASNRLNDVPCNYGTGANLPADYTSVQSLLTTDSPNDNFQFTVSDLNITGTSLPFDPNSEASVYAYLSQFDGVLFFKHWSTGVTDELQQAMVSFADNGGGVLAIHHGLYNDIDGVLNKDILVHQLFGIESAMNSWSANIANIQLYSMNHGHFVSTFGVGYFDSSDGPLEWDSNPPMFGSNVSGGPYQRFPVTDEIYNNMSFVDSPVFGWGVNEITPLLSNDQYPVSQMHTSGFVKKFDSDLDGVVGKVAYFETGERPVNFTLVSPYAQIIRNAMLWVVVDSIPENTGGINVADLSSGVNLFPNPVLNELEVLLPNDFGIVSLRIYDLNGNLVREEQVETEGLLKLDVKELQVGFYLIQLDGEGGISQLKFVKK